MGAATIPPVGAWVIALRIISERTTASRCGPSKRQCPDHSRHQCSASAAARDASAGAGAGSCDARHVKANGTRCPSHTSKSAAVTSPSSLRGTPAWRWTRSGPATATIPPSTGRSRGTTEPKSKRRASSIRTGTLPRRPSTMRTRSGWSARGGMQSMTATVPEAVSNSVSSTSVSPRYRRRTLADSPAGANRQRPCSGVPSSAARHAAESNFGRQSQSIEPSRPTSAAVWQSPMRAYSSRRRAIVDPRQVPRLGPGTHGEVGPSP